MPPENNDINDIINKKQDDRIRKLEEELAESKQALARIPQLYAQMELLKTELLQVTGQKSNQFYTPEPVSKGDMSNAQFSSYAKILSELQQDIYEIRRSEEHVSLARTELDRLNKAIHSLQVGFDNLSKEFAQRDSSTSYIEEQRRVDTRHLTELRMELPDLRKKVEANLSKVQVVEKQIPQFGRYEGALENIRKDIQRYRERMDFQTVQNERLLKSWTELSESHERRLAEFATMAEKYAKHYQLNKRALASLQEFQEHLQREQHQAGELQRLAEERQRSSMEKWRGENEHHWQKQGMEWQPKIEDVQNSINHLREQQLKAEKFNRDIEQQLDLILQIIEEDILARSMATHNWQQRFEELANERE